ncbi:hypothetical protein ACVWWG_006534 [Bradyrhizobium sp. LB7.2]
MPPNFIGPDHTEPAAVDHRAQRHGAWRDRTLGIRQSQIEPATAALQLELRAVGARAPKFRGCDGAEETAFAAGQAFAFHQHLAVWRIKRDRLPCLAIITAEQHDYRRLGPRMTRVHA